MKDALDVENETGYEKAYQQEPHDAEGSAKETTAFYIEIDLGGTASPPPWPATRQGPMRVRDKMVAWSEPKMRYQFLIDTYQTEIVKVLGVWSMFDDADLRRRPHPTDPRGRSLLEHMVHQCFSEDFWFKTMLGIQVTDAPLPENETRLGFMQYYARDSALRLAALVTKTEDWWEGETSFFEERRTRLWVMTRRLTHTSHHRGQQTTLLRIVNHSLHSTYGPTADTGGLMINHAPTVYAYGSQSDMLTEEEGARRKTPLPGPGEKPFTERPDRSGPRRA